MLEVREGWRGLQQGEECEYLFPAGEQLKRVLETSVSRYPAQDGRFLQVYPPLLPLPSLSLLSPLSPPPSLSLSPPLSPHLLLPPFQISGFSFGFNGTKAAGDRVEWIKVDGLPIDYQRKYTAATKVEEERGREGGRGKEGERGRGRGRGREGGRGREEKRGEQEGKRGRGVLSGVGQSWAANRLPEEVYGRYKGRGREGGRGKEGERGRGRGGGREGGRGREEKRGEQEGKRRSGVGELGSQGLQRVYGLQR